MRSKVWHHLGATLLMIFAHTSMISCSSSEEQEGLTEEVGDGENAASQEGGENAASEEGQGGEEGNASQEGGEEGQEGNAAEGDDAGAQNQSENATDDQAADGQQQGDLQEIIDDMNASSGGEGNGVQAETLQQAPADDANATGGDAVAQGNVPADPAVDAAAAPVPADGANAAPATAAPAVTDAPAPANDASGLPEMNAKMSYIVQKGDTLVKIAQKIYGDPTKWTEIASFTGLANPKMIYPGDVVYYQLNDSTKAFAMAYESVKRAEVQVQQGDTLSTIAGRVLGSNENWKLIWRQNDNIDDPDKLMVGTTVYYVEPSALADAVTHFREVLAQQKQVKAQNEIASVEAKPQTPATDVQPTAKIKNLKTVKVKTQKLNNTLPNSVDNEIEADLVSVNFVKNMNVARLI